MSMTQFRIPLSGPAPDLQLLEDALQDADPSVLLDIEPLSRVLRISTLLDEHSLLPALGRGGLPVSAAQLERVPSECCGGCGG